jgi:hypothetical protein
MNSMPMPEQAYYKEYTSYDAASFEVDVIECLRHKVSLITGPAGSGKSHRFYSLLQNLRSSQVLTPTKILAQKKSLKFPDISSITNWQQ